MDLFVRLHGMLFTKIQLDDFQPVMSRYMERLEEDASLDVVNRRTTITQVDWILMGAINITAVLQYGSSLGVIRKALAQEGQERRRQQGGAAETHENGFDGADQGVHPADRSSPSAEEGDLPSLPTAGAHATPTLTDAIELAFAVFKSGLDHPTRLQGIHPVLNPYITILFTFLATLFRQPHVGAVLLPFVPWRRLIAFVNTADLEVNEESRLAVGPPLPEDWAVRGEEWVGRRVYERGFWKGKGSGRGSGVMAQPRIGERFQSEMDVLLASFDSAMDINEGVVEEVEGTDLTDGPVAVNQRRWKRVAWAAGVIVKHVDGLRLEEGKVVIEGTLAATLTELEAEKTKAVEEKREVTTEDFEEEIADDLVDTDSDGDDPELGVLRVSEWLAAGD